MSIQQSKLHWDELGNLDPCWAILSEPGKRYGGWDLTQFFATGQAEIAEIMRVSDRFGLPTEKGRALDFGCGIGRLTNALACHFRRVVGIDISQSMIRQAECLNQLKNCEYLVNVTDSLPFSSAHFDLIYTVIVLQHMLNQDSIRQYISEFMRILKPGGLLVMQLPSHIPLRRRLQVRRRLYAWLRMTGISERVLYNRFHLHPIPMNFLPESEVATIVASAGGRILEARPDHRAGAWITSRTYFVTK